MHHNKPNSIRAIAGSVLFYVLTGIAAIPFLLFLPLLGIPKKYTWWLAKTFLTIQLWLLWLCCGVRFKLSGLEHLPKGPVLWASQHESTWETLYFQSLLDNPSMFAKKEIFEMPLIGMLTRWNGHIPVDRGGSLDAMREGFKAATEASKAGRSVLIFPSGTRDVAGRGTLHSGVGVLYQILGLPVVPVRLNSGHCWPSETWVKSPGVIHVEILAPIEPKLNRRDLLDQLAEQLDMELK